MKNIKLLISISAVVINTSCKKNNTGGQAIVMAHVGHHNTAIYGARVYVKFNARELPEDPENNYDLKVEAESVENHIHIQGLRYGQYYLYAVGYDSSLKQTVKGGLALSISWNERKKQLEVDIPVTE